MGGGRPSATQQLVDLRQLAAGKTRPKGTIKLRVHIDGSARGEVVAVTEERVIAAINSRTLSARDALSFGLFRLYGSSSDVASVRSWLQARDPQ